MKASRAILHEVFDTGARFLKKDSSRRPVVVGTLPISRWEGQDFPLPAFVENVKNKW
jgi:hypothetical protein